MREREMEINTTVGKYEDYLYKKQYTVDIFIYI